MTPRCLHPGSSRLEKMSRRTKRIDSAMQNEIGQMILTKLADPRIDPARVSVTRVEVADDLLTLRIRR